MSLHKFHRRNINIINIINTTRAKSKSNSHYMAKRDACQQRFFARILLHRSYSRQPITFTTTIPASMWPECAVGRL